MSLRDDTSKEVITALKAGEKLKVSSLRLLLSAVKYKEVDLKRELSDEETQQIIATLIRQRQDSVEQYRKGGRDELADKEEAEIVILRAYLPPQMSAEELRAVVKEAAEKTGATGPGDMGKLMGVVMPLVKGKAEGRAVSDMVKEVLAE